jgi:hypothetical protein
MRRFLRRLIKTVTWMLALAAFVQVIPYGRSYSNPPVVQEPTWDSPRTRELAVRACFDCHSNETEWPTYAHVAPMSWVLERDVDMGRAVFNFSEWTPENDLAAEASGSVLRREMPPRTYRMMHGHARLTEAERVELARGLDATFGTARTIATK